MSKLDKYTERGFKWYKPVANCTVYESSNAAEPKLWLKVQDDIETITELSWQQALQLAETLSEAVRQHYQLEETE